MGWLKAIKRWFTGRAADDAARAVEIARQALPIVELVARLTPTRADDEILRLFTLFGLPAVDSFLALPVEARGRALMHAAATQLARIVPGVPGRVLDLAVQMAVVELRGAGAVPAPAPAPAAAPADEVAE